MIVSFASAFRFLPRVLNCVSVFLGLFDFIIHSFLSSDSIRYSVALPFSPNLSVQVPSTAPLQSALVSLYSMCTPAIWDFPMLFSLVGASVS